MKVNTKKLTEYQPTIHEGAKGGTYYAAPLIHNGITDPDSERVLFFNVFDPRRRKVVPNPIRGERVWVVCRGLHAINSLTFDNFDEADGQAFDLAQQENLQGQVIYNFDLGQLPLMIGEGEAY